MKLDPKVEAVIPRLVEVVGDMHIDSYEGLCKSRLFTWLFGEFARLYTLNRTNDSYALDCIDNDDPLMESKGTIIDFEPTLDNLLNVFGAVSFQTTHSNVTVVCDHLIIQIHTDSTNNDCAIHEITIATNRHDLTAINEMIVGSFVYKKSINDENSYKIAYKGQYSIETTVCKFNDWKSNLNSNYNDDLPYTEINSIIRSDKAGLIMFYGVPGTGKTSLVKSLINDNRDTNFIFVDTSLCESISDGMFLDFLQDNKNCVLVFEDCEKLLQSRNSGQNDSIGTILNLTDGIIAESMKIKFICTFNCNLNKVDEALLRKGRLSLKYEFKELSLEKTKAIYPEAEKPMTLADAHNAYVKNDFSTKKTNKIGFA